MKKNLSKLIKIQQDIFKKAVFKPLNKDIKKILAFDVSFEKDNGYCCGVLMDLNFNVIEKHFTHQKVNFPYIPTFLAFRELPLILKTYRKFKNKPDIIFFDGQGIIHPRKCGIATHAGVILNVPSVGVAKSHLYGKYKKPENKKFAFSYVYDNSNDILGVVFVSRENTKPTFISPGNLIDLNSAIEIVKKTIRKYRTPEPLRQAHIESNRFRKKFH